MKTRGSSLILELKILVPCEIHDHESTISLQSTFPVLSENGCERSNGSSRADIEVAQSLERSRACVQGNGIQLRNLSIFWRMIYDDTIMGILILQVELEPVDGNSCTTKIE